MPGVMIRPLSQTAGGGRPDGGARGALGAGDDLGRRHALRAVRPQGPGVRLRRAQEPRLAEVAQAHGVGHLPGVAAQEHVL